ncbi:hypothetical protein BJ508DRAFT_371968 [Ascobolus immersus RN42]|uniref:Uncharacterized protein n=1 Tax=Ascobolus immersus RN42 TaxID=1160509 RepID=A0A3N4IPM8_ASCIM|nr:hypothetical protein BJ508DRAFT_371968 [Ascobolus immersus RN42]
MSSPASSKSAVEPKIASSFFTPPYREVSKPTTNETTSLLGPQSPDSDLESGYGSIPDRESPQRVPSSEFTRDYVGARLAEFAGWDNVRSEILGFWFFVIVAVVIIAVFLVFVIVLVETVGRFAGGEGSIAGPGGWPGALPSLDLTGRALGVAGDVKLG